MLRKVPLRKRAYFSSKLNRSGLTATTTKTNLREHIRHDEARLVDHRHRVRRQRQLALQKANRGTGENRTEFDWLAKIRERGIMLDYFVQNERRINLAEMLRLDEATIFTVIDLGTGSSSLSLSSLIQLNPILLARQLGHRALVILDDRQLLEMKDQEEHEQLTKQIMFDLFEIAKNTTLHFTPQTALRDMPALIVLRMTDIGAPYLNARQLLRQVRGRTSDPLTTQFRQAQQIADLERINESTGAKIQVVVTPRSDAFDCSYLKRMDKAENDEPNVIIACDYLYEHKYDGDLLSQIHLNQRDTSIFELERFISKKLIKTPATLTEGLRYMKDDKKRETEKYLADQAMKHIHLFLPVPGGEIREVQRHAKYGARDHWQLKNRFREWLIKLLHDTKGRQSAVRMRRCMQGDCRQIATATREELDQVFRDVITLELYNERDVTISEILIQYGFFDDEQHLQTEIKAGKLLKDHGVWINQG